MAKAKAAKPAKKAAKAAKKVVKKAAKPVKKAPSKKSAPKKAPSRAVKKAAAKKAPARKAAVKKAATKAVKKAPAKKAVAKAPAKATKAATRAPAKKAAAKAPAKAAREAPVKAPAKATKAAKAAPAKAAPEKKPAAEAASKAEAVKPAKAGRPAKAAPAKEISAAPPPLLDDEAFDLDVDVEEPALLEDPVLEELEELDIEIPKAPLKVPGKRGRPPKKARSLAEMLGRKPKKEKIPKRLRRRRRLSEDDIDLPVAPRAPAPRDTMSIEEIRADVQKRYLAGETPMCPVGCGGMAQVVRVSSLPSGAGDVWLECLSCAQRERFEIPAPTAEERQNAFEQLEAGNEPVCPRHGERWVQMRRRGRDFACPECGILIAGRES